MVPLAEVLDHCLSDGGKVFIPAFSLGRTQEILYELDRIFSSARIPSTVFQGWPQAPVRLFSSIRRWDWRLQRSIRA